MAIERIGVQPIIVSAGAPGQQVYRLTELDGGTEGEPSVDVACTNDLSVDGNVNFIHWLADSNTVRVHRSLAGQFEPIADVEGTSYIDHGPVEIG